MGSPAAGMPESALKQRPDETTPCPFLTGLLQTGKRSAAEMDDGAEQEDTNQIVPDQVFISRLPANIEERRLKAAFKSVGTIVDIRLARDETEGRPCKGFGWITFSSEEEAQTACDLDGLLVCGGKKMSIAIAKQQKDS